MKLDIYKKKYGRITAAALTALFLGAMMLSKSRRIAGYNSMQADAMLVELAIWGVCAVCMITTILCPRMKQHRLFILLAGCIGLCYAFAITPLSVPDEMAHYKNAVAMASNLVNGGMTDTNLLSFEGFSYHENTPLALQTYLHGLGSEQLTGVTEVCPWVCRSYPLMYIPQTLAASLVMLLKLNRMWIYLLGDIFNLVQYIALTALAIKLIPRGKTPMVLAAVTPMAMQQASSLSADGFVTGMAFLLIALLIRAIERRSAVKWQELACILAVGVLMAPAKAVYFLLLLLLVLIPKERFGSAKNKWLFLGGSLVLAAAATVLVQIGWLTQQVESSTAGTTSNYTIGWVLTHPVQTAVVVINTLIPRGLFWYVDSCIGRELSGLSLEIFPGYIYGMLFIILLAALTDRDNPPPTAFQRTVFLGTSVLVMLATMGTMMIAWTQMGASAIEGVQGRYFIPLMPLILISLGNHNFSGKKDLTNGYAIGMVALQLVTLNEIMAIMIQSAV